MDYRQLGRSGVKVSPLCLGTMMFGGQTGEPEAARIIAKAKDQGLNFIDTADVYNEGRSEEVVGRAIHVDRDHWVLATKMANPMGPGPNRRGLSRRWMFQATDDSLTRLGTDWIDIMYLHKEDHDTPLEETVGAMVDLVQTGKIRYFGLSNETAWGTMQYLRLSTELGLPRVQTIQNEYNFLRRYYDMDLAELAHHEDVGLLAYSPLAAGALSGKYLGGVLPPGTRGEIAGGNYRNNELTEPAIRAYIALAEKHGLDVCQMATAFCLTKPFMTSVIIGATNMDQLKSNIDAVDVKLSPEVIEGIQQIFMRHARTL
jgi:aryl-alcohol dehydrogenase-like predicted oxidoreductase